MSNLPSIWSGTEEVSIPSSTADITEIVPLAAGLTKSQQHHLIAAFNDLKAYDMAVEYAWRKTLSRLKESIASLGMQFIGEMLGREEITDSTPYESVLTEIQTIQLAEQLGLISNTAGMHLRHAHELIVHFSSRDAKEEFDMLSALSIIKNSVKYVLGNQDKGVALEFSKFRDRLLRENLKENDPQLEMLINSPLFYARTVTFILLNSIRKDQGAKIEHALANFSVILPSIWEKLSENEKWDVGFAYRDVVSENNTYAANGLKVVLSKVKGFDFVPESLRSNTFVKAAQHVLDVHYAFNNFYNEPSAVRALASLGSTIPKPAFLKCMQAYLVVCIGNRYGVSNTAADIAYSQLENVPKDRWKYYFEKGINTDKEILYNLDTYDQINRFIQLIRRLGINDFKDLPVENQRLYDALLNGKTTAVKTIADGLYNKIR